MVFDNEVFDDECVNCMELIPGGVGVPIDGVFGLHLCCSEQCRDACLDSGSFTECASCGEACDTNRCIDTYYSCEKCCPSCSICRQLLTASDYDNEREREYAQLDQWICLQCLHHCQEQHADALEAFIVGVASYIPQRSDMFRKLLSEFPSFQSYFHSLDETRKIKKKCKKNKKNKKKKKPHRKNYKTPIFLH